MASKVEVLLKHLLAFGGIQPSAHNLQFLDSEAARVIHM